MARVKCYNCGNTWDLSQATTNRCSQCGWIIEIYFDPIEAQTVTNIYNNQPPPLPKGSGYCALEGLDGYAVSFPDQHHLAEVAGQLLDAHERTLPWT